VCSSPRLSTPLPSQAEAWDIERRAHTRHGRLCACSNEPQICRLNEPQTHHTPTHTSCSTTHHSPNNTNRIPCWPPATNLHPHTSSHALLLPWHRLWGSKAPIRSALRHTRTQIENALTKTQRQSQHARVLHQAGSKPKKTARDLDRSSNLLSRSKKRPHLPPPRRRHDPNSPQFARPSPKNTRH
jgi:hypothetical protein